MIAFVQQNRTLTSGTATSSVSFSATPTPGNLIIVVTEMGSPGLNAISSVADNQTGNTYTQVGTTRFTAGNNCLQLWYAQNVNATGTFTVTATPSTTTSSREITILEYSGAAISGVFDQAASTTGNSTTPSGGSITPTKANSLVIGAFTDDGTTGTTIAQGTGYTLRNSDTDGTTDIRNGVEDLIQTTAAAATGSFTIGSAFAWAAIVASFNVATTFTFQQLTTTQIPPEFHARLEVVSY